MPVAPDSPRLADLLEGLNPEQRKAVETTEGPLLVLAGAGSGKTRVLVHRLAYLVGVCGIPAENLLAVTFTNKAAGEMRERVEKLLGPAAHGLWVTTFHAACVRILRRDIGHLGLSRGFVIYDEDDSLGTVKEALRRHGLDPKAYDPRRLRWRIDQWKNAGVLPAEAESAAKGLDDEVAAELYATYQRLLAEANALDFGDLILQTVRLFDRFPEVLAHYRRRWQYVLVDEYQDTNRVQYRLVDQLAGEHRNLCVVGDPDQCIPGHARVATPDGPKPISEIRAGDHVVSGAGWGEAIAGEVVRATRRPYSGRIVRVTTQTGHVLEATPNHICFARLDPVRGMHYVYLMWRRGLGFRIGTTSGVRRSGDGAVLNGMLVRTNQEVADAIWVLHAGRSLGEARFTEQLLSVRYGIPTMVFHVRGRRMAVDQAWVDRLFAEIDTEANAKRLMDDLEIDPRFPHLRPYALVRRGFQRRYVWFTMFGDPRVHTLRPWHEHRVQIVTSDDELGRKARTRFPVRDGKKGTWRIETSRKDYDAASALAREIAELDRLEVIQRARLTRSKAFALCPASHLRVGMVVPVLSAGGVIEDTIESVATEDYTGEVCDLEVKDLRNFAVGGTVVHNSIYAWRGADIRNILDFERDHPDATVVKLERNYRSTQPILEGASAVVANNQARRDKRMFTERADGEKIRLYEAVDDRDEAQFVVRQILAAVREEGRAYGDCAVFYRTNAQSRPFEEQLLAHDVPYSVVGGVRFYERAEVKDALAYLRLLVNPADGMALRRIVNVPARGIGKASVERAEEIAAARDLPLLEALRLAADDGAAGRSGAKIRAFLELVSRLRDEVLALAPAEALARVLDRTGYLESLEKQATPEAEGRLENLRELLSGAEDFALENAGVSGDERTLVELFLDQVALVSDLDAWKGERDRVSLMSVHMAKGLEFPVVFLVGLEEGLLPHVASQRTPAAIEEERRLCYVGMTRAMERLFLTCASERRRFGSRSFNPPSRFLSELPEAVTVGASFDRGGRAFEPGTHRSFDYSMSQDEAVEADGLRVGLRVRHPIFGPGTVAAVRGIGAGCKLDVRFDRVGMKTVLLRFANLEPL